MTKKLNRIRERLRAPYWAASDRIHDATSLNIYNLFCNDIYDCVYIKTYRRIRDRVWYIDYE